MPELDAVMPAAAHLVLDDDPGMVAAGVAVLLQDDGDALLGPLLGCLSGEELVYSSTGDGGGTLNTSVEVLPMLPAVSTLVLWYYEVIKVKTQAQGSFVGPYRMGEGGGRGEDQS